MTGTGVAVGCLLLACVSAAYLAGRVSSDVRAGLLLVVSGLAGLNAHLLVAWGTPW